MANTERSILADGLPGPEFVSALIGDYRKNLNRFFDQRTGAIKEKTRDDGRPAFLFSEVTGYAIADLLLLHSITGDPLYLESAIKASDWLIHTASDERGWIRTRYYFERDAEDELRLNSFTGGNIFAFDNGICLGGLTALYGAIREETCRRPELAEKVETLTGRIQILSDNLIASIGPDGSVPAILTAEGVEVRPDSPRWSQRRGSFHAKIAESFAELYALTTQPRYAEAASRICKFVISHQQENGRFVTDDKGSTQLHPHCYSAEGLFRAGTILKEESFVASARRATEWALQQLCEGKIAQEIGGSTSGASSFRTDALAQVLSLGARMLQTGILSDRYWQAVSNLAESVWAMKDPHKGFFRHGYYEDGKPSSTLSYWTNMFAFHSLLEYVAARISKDLSVIVLAGGIGSRCWPVSCVSLPKPLSRGLLGQRSLLEETVGRLLKTGCVRPRNVFVLSTTAGLNESQEQMRWLTIPLDNILEEVKPKGTLAALQYALTKVGDRLRENVLVLTADNLIEPLSAFRDTLIRAALAAWWDETGVIVSLGVPDKGCDPRYGHAIHRKDNEVIPGVYRVDRFVEKPRNLASLELQTGESFAWDSGCILSRRDYFKSIIGELSSGGRPPKGLEGDITRQILERQKFCKAVALYPPIIRFADVGAPGKDLREFFLGTKADNGNGNIFLGSENAEAVFLEARSNIVISDRMSIEVVGIDNHLIIDSSYTNSAVMLPLDKVDILPIVYRMLEGVEGFHPYIVGGEITRHASPHNLAYDCRGQCNIDSTNGLVLASCCTNIQMKRTADRLLVVEQSRLTPDKSLVEKAMAPEAGKMTRFGWTILDSQAPQEMICSPSE